MAQRVQQLGDVEAQIQRGEFAPLVHWLREQRPRQGLVRVHGRDPNRRDRLGPPR